jgi:phosphatidylserine synthase
MRWNIGPFGVKDLFTLINLFGGVAAIHFVLVGRFELAGYALLVGYLFGDSLDGMVARATKTSNQFGSELDTATDHFSQAIVTCATIRQALFSVAKLGDPLMYCGLPRTVSGYASMAFVLSRFFFRGELGFALGDLLIPTFALMNLLPIPYMTHRGGRRMQWYVRVVITAFLITPTAAFILARPYTFDVLFFWLFGYAATAWIPIYPEEKRAFFTRYRAWAAEVSRP